MKTKIIMGISIAAALGASAVGATLVCKPTPINNTVYAKNISNTKNVKKETVILYEPNQNLINKENTSSMITKNGKKYINETFSMETGKLIPTIESVTKLTNINVKNATSLGNAVIKKCDTSKNITNPQGDIFGIPCNKVEVKLPIGTKLKVLWTSQTLVNYNNQTHKPTLANVAAVDYNGKLAFISDDYLNLDNVATGEKAMQLVSKDQLKTAHYIGTSKAVSNLPLIDPINHKPNPVNIIVPVNGMNYHLNVRGKTVNVIYYGGNVFTHIKPNEMVGETFGPAEVGGEKYAKVEYNGIIGYMYYGNLSNTPKSAFNG